MSIDIEQLARKLTFDVRYCKLGSEAEANALATPLAVQRQAKAEAFEEAAGRHTPDMTCAQFCRDKATALRNPTKEP